MRGDPNRNGGSDRPTFTRKKGLKMQRFTHLAAAAALSVCALAACPASAADFMIDIGPDASSADFGNTGDTSGQLNDTYTFTVPAGSANGFVGSIALTPALNVTFTSVLLDSTPFERVLSDGTELFTLNPTQLAAGSHTIFVNGTWGSEGGSYAGTLNFAPGIVPEPTTWAMLIGGFAITGGAMRRRSQRTSTTVRFV